MNKLYALGFAALLLLLASAPAQADLIFTATINGAQETPPNNSTATGSARFVLNDAMTTFAFSGTVFGLDFTGSQSSDPSIRLVNAHIHGGAGLGAAAPVVFGFIGTPFNDTDGDVVVTPFATGVGGTFSSKWDLPEGNNTTLAAQLPNILSGNSYINFHTVGFPGGAVRGQIFLQAIVPEPSTIALLLTGGTGLLGTCLFRRRGKKAIV